MPRKPAKKTEDAPAPKAGKVETVETLCPPIPVEQPPAFESQFEQWCWENLIIQDRQDQRFRKFRFNKVQKKLWRFINEQYRETKRVRIIILKARREGVSTLIEAIGYYRVATSMGTHALVMAHDADSTQSIFDMTHNYHVFFPGGGSKTQHLQRKQIYFAAPMLSWFKANTAGSKHYGSGAAIHFLHLSELAKWKENVIRDLLVSVKNAVPDANETAIIIESTAQGASGPFYDSWQEANKPHSVYKPVFFSWLEDDQYTEKPGTKLTDPKYASVPLEWTDKEQFIRECGATEEQLCWRRRIIEEKCNGVPELFDQEYPTTPMCAFLSSGAPVFPASICKRRLEECTEQNKKTPPQRFAVAYGPDVPSEAAIESSPRGPLKVWERPKPNRSYLITGDISTGRQVNPDAKSERPRRDYSALYVFDRVDQKVVASWHGQIEAWEVGRVFYHLGMWYNRALVCPEVNLPGINTVQFLLQAHYPHMFIKEKVDRPTHAPVQQNPQASATDYGWRTGQTGTKWVMVNTLKRFVTERGFSMPDEAFWDEALTYEVQPDGKIDARSGCHDDRIIAAAIGAVIIEEHPPSVTVQQKPITPDTEAYFEALAEMRRPVPQGVFYLT